MDLIWRGNNRVSINVIFPTVILSTVGQTDRHNITVAAYYDAAGRFHVYKWTS